MKKKILAIAMVAISVAQAMPAFAAEYTAKAYDVTVADELKVPYKYSTADYFNGGLVTGFGSAVTFKGINENGEMEFYAVTDRGPNADAPQYSADGKTSAAKIFPCPEFSPSIGVVTVKENGAEVNSAITLKNADGSAITGLPLEPDKVGSTNEVALDIDLNNIGYDNNGLDTEGIAVDKDGNFWICDEYGPFIVKVAKDGTVLEKYAPGDGLPEVLASRIANRGFEGLTITPSGKVIASVQSVLNVNGETSKTATFTRMVELDPETKEVKMFAYPVDLSKYKSAKDCKIGDIYAVDDNTLLVIEQGKGADGKMNNVIYKADLTAAEDISDVTYEGKAPEYAANAEETGISFIKKEAYIDLRAAGWTAEKAEGVCMVDENTIAVINDNDFGIVTEISDTENEGADITDYVYNSADKTYTYEEKAAAPVISIGENTEPAQIWIFKAEEEKAAKGYVMLRNLAVKMQGTENAFALDFDAEAKTVELAKGAEYTVTGAEDKDAVAMEISKDSSEWKLSADGTETSAVLYNVKGSNYISIEDAEKILGCEINY